MSELLCRLFVKNHTDTTNTAVRRDHGTLVSIVGILLNTLLCAGKLFAGLMTGAVSMTADAINNLSDAGSQVISLISFKLAAKPADRDHPFGHARIEYVASMAISFLIILIGFELFKSSNAIGTQNNVFPDGIKDEDILDVFMCDSTVVVNVSDRKSVV